MKRIVLGMGFTLIALADVYSQTCPTVSSDTTVTSSCNTGIELFDREKNFTIGTPTSGLVEITNSSFGAVIRVYTEADSTINNTSSGYISAGAGSGYPDLYTGDGIAIYNRATVTTLTNSGTISAGVGGTGIYNDVSADIFTLSNSGVISVGERGNGIFNHRYIGTLTSSGTISAGERGYGIYNSGRSGSFIATLTNSGTISAGVNGIGIRSLRTIETLTNTSTGTIYAGDNGYGISGTITTLNNLGTIYAGDNGYGISGAITTLNNLQGVGNIKGALTYTGILPTNYNIIINSSSNYGQLVVISPSGATTFGIYTGSSVRAGVYSSVLSGITSANLVSTSGKYNRFRWIFSNSSSDIWDLLVYAPSTANTQQSLVNTASVLQGTFTLQNSVMVNGFTYDCPLFDKHGICVSAGGRNTSVQAQGINNTSGLLIASYRLDKNNSRIGAWVDQNLSVSSPSAVKLSNSTPMIGLFGVWSQRPDGVGAEVKVSAAYGQKDTTITRQVVGSAYTASEPGSGGSQLISQGVQVVAKYGFAMMSDVVVSPYAGVRYTQNNMGGYTEAETNTVAAPLTYSSLNTNATTVLAGAKVRYRGIPKTTLYASAGVETDTNTANGTYSATGVDGLTPVNFNPNPVKTRPTATVGGYYDIMKNQQIGITGIYRQEPYQAISTTTVLATYTIGL